MSDQVPAQEQSAPAPTPTGRERFSGLPANDIADQLATAMMNNQGQATIDALQAELAATAGAKAPEPEPVAAVVPKEQQPEPTPTPEPEVPVVEKSPEEIAAEATAAEEAKAAAEEAKEPNRVRINHLSEPDKAAQLAINALTKGGMSLLEATQRVLGVGKSEPAPEPELEPVIPPEITALETEIAALEAKMDEAGAGEGLLNKDFTDLTKQLSKANAKLEAARSRHESAAETQAVVSDATFEQQRHGVLVATAKDFPQMTDKTSEQWKLARKLAKAASDPLDEDYQKSLSLDAPRYFAEQAAKLLGIKPKTAAAPSAPQPPTPSTPSTQPPKPSPVPGSKTTVPTVIPTAQQVLAAADQMVADVLSGRGGPPKPKTPNYLILGR